MEIDRVRSCCSKAAGRKRHKTSCISRQQNNIYIKWISWVTWTGFIRSWKVMEFENAFSRPGKVMKFGENDQGHGKVMKLKFPVLIYAFLLHQNLEYPFNWAKVCWEDTGCTLTYVFLFVIIQYAVHTWSYSYSTYLPRYSTCTSRCRSKGNAEAAKKFSILYT